MAIFTMRFEHYVQEFIEVEVEAEDLAEAMEASSSLDLEDYAGDWQEDGEITDPRLYGVREGEEYVVTVDLTPGWCWIDDDLRDQWHKDPDRCLKRAASGF